MLLDCENGARRGVIRVIHHYTEARNERQRKMYKSAREDQGQHSKHYGGKTIRPHLTVAETQGRTILKKQGCYEAKTQKSMKL